MSMSSSTWRKGVPRAVEKNVRSAFYALQHFLDQTSPRRLRRTSRVQVLKTDVKRSIRVRVEDGALLTSHVLGAAVLVANGISDLQCSKGIVSSVDLKTDPKAVNACSDGICLVLTHVHVDSLAIALESADGRGHDDKSVLADKIPDTALLAIGGKVELEGVYCGDE